MWAFGILGMYFLTSFYLQGILGFSPVKAGLAFLPMAVFIAMFATISEQVAARISAHRMAALDLALMAGGLYLFARQGMHSTYLDLMPGFLIFSAGARLMQAPLTVAVVESMPSGRSGVASALLNASREVAGLLGITVIGAVLSSREAGRCAAAWRRPGRSWTATTPVSPPRSR